MGKLDEDVSTFLSSREDDESRIGIDLTDISYFEPAAMVFLLAILRNLDRMGCPPVIRYPRDSRVISAMMTYKYFETLRVVRGLGGMRELGVDDLGHARHDSLEQDLRKTYFPLRVVSGKDDSDTPGVRHVDDEIERVNDPKVLSWLQSHLHSLDADDTGWNDSFVRDTYPPRIVFEAMMNAVRHPNATKIIATSHIDKDSNSQESFFTAVWWDDGAGIVETLKEALRSSRGVVSDASPLPEKTCWISFKDSKPARPAVLQTTNFVPAADSLDEEILFSSICSRITRDPDGTGHVTTLPNDVPFNSPWRQPGMGLYILVDCAINIFGGSVAFRTGEFFMSVKRGKAKGEERADYSVSISRPGNGFRFLGNMLSVRLPIRDQLPQAISR